MSIPLRGTASIHCSQCRRNRCRVRCEFRLEPGLKQDALRLGTSLQMKRDGGRVTLLHEGRRLLGDVTCRYHLPSAADLSGKVTSIRYGTSSGRIPDSLVVTLDHQT